jgi:hypothetical protein
VLAVKETLLLAAAEAAQVDSKQQQVFKYLLVWRLLLLLVLERRLKQVELDSHQLAVTLCFQVLRLMVAVAAISTLMQIQVETDHQNQQALAVVEQEAIILLVTELLVKVIKAVRLIQIMIATLQAAAVALVRLGLDHPAITKVVLAALVLHHLFLDHL